MTKFAIFDLDDTLVDYVGAIDAWFIEFAEQRALGPDGLAFLRAEQERPVSPEESFQAIVDRFGLADSPIELQRSLMERLPLLCRTFDGVAAGLEALRQSGWRTALLTNGVESTQRLKMRDGLHDLFDALCFADDEGVRKPDPAIFQLVASRAGVELAGAWMIGDSLHSDIAGAAGLRMSTIWVSGGAPLPDGGPRPDKIVTTIAEAFPLLLHGLD